MKYKVIFGSARVFVKGKLKIEKLFVPVAWESESNATPTEDE